MRNHFLARLQSIFRAVRDGAEDLAGAVNHETTGPATAQQGETAQNGARRQLS